MIKLKDDECPHALYTSRNIPIVLYTKVKEELNCMEQLGVIHKISEPIVCGDGGSPKKSGAIRICVDLKPLNEGKCTTFPQFMRSWLSQSSRAKIFSKLDANSGFWQIPLAAKSQPLTAFITPYG